MCAGRHAAIVRINDNDKFEYLELQSGLTNGWKNAPIGIDGKQDLNTLFGWRFGCAPSEFDSPIMIDIEDMYGSYLFHRALGYANTSSTHQV